MPRRTAKSGTTSASVAATTAAVAAAPAADAADRSGAGRMEATAEASLEARAGMVEGGGRGAHRLNETTSKTTVVSRHSPDSH
jgi:hypothetical protein